MHWYNGTIYRIELLFENDSINNNIVVLRSINVLIVVSIVYSVKDQSIIMDQYLMFNVVGRKTVEC